MKRLSLNDKEYELIKVLLNVAHSDLMNNSQCYAAEYYKEIESLRLKTT